MIGLTLHNLFVQRLIKKTTKYNFSNFTFPSNFASKIYNKNLTLQKAKDDQQKLEILINVLNNDYNPQNPGKVKKKDDTLKSAKELFFLSGKKLLKHLRGIFFRM